MISYAEAISIILSQTMPLQKATQLLLKSVGYVLAEDIKADRDYPPFNRSAVDGYAFYSPDNIVPGSLEIQDIIYAGDNYTDIVSPGCCVKIMTGAAVPPALNIVVRKEDTIVEDTTVKFISDIKLSHFQNIAQKGEDAVFDFLILKAGTQIKKQHIPTLATVGGDPINVYAPLSIGVITTGNEVVPATSSHLQTTQIRNCNTYSIQTILASYPVEIEATHAVDQKERFQESIESYSNKDIIILTGGVSAGDTDYLPEVLSSLGYTCLFHKVAIKPGKPIWFGKHTKRNQIVFALPGNPYSVLTALKIFVEPFLLNVLRQSQSTSMIHINGNRKKKNTLDEFLPVKKTDFGYELISINGSGDITSILNADGIILHSKDYTEINNSIAIPYYPF
ncbi:MAG: molybdopterin molybdotransferase MoeA [Cytophagaceae bacterium]